MLYVAVGDNANGSNSQTLAQPPRQDPAHPSRRHDPVRRIPSSAHATRREPRHLGARASAIRSPSPSSPAPAGCSSTTSGRTRGRRSTTGSPAPTTAGRPPKGRRPIRASARRSSPTGTAAARRRLRDHRRRLLQPADRPVPEQYVGDYFFADYCSGWIRKLDPANGNAVASFATGIAQPGRSRGRSDGSLYYLARGSGRRRLPRRLHGQPGPEHHDAPVEPDGARRAARRPSASRPAARRRSRTSGSGTASTFAGATSAAYTPRLGARPADNGARFRARRHERRPARRREQRGDADGHREPGADRHDLRACVRNALQRRGDDRRTPGRARTPRTATSRRAPSPGGSTSTTTTHIHPFVAADERQRRAGRSSCRRRAHRVANVWYRIHLTVRDSGGLTHSTFRDVLPRTVQLTLATSPAASR